LKPKVSNQKQKADKPKAGGSNNKPRDEDPQAETSAERETDASEKAVEGNEILPISADFGMSQSEVTDLPIEVPEPPSEEIEVAVKD